jgi:hypothetical protein
MFSDCFAPPSQRGPLCLCLPGRPSQRTAERPRAFEMHRQRTNKHDIEGFLLAVSRFGSAYCLTSTPRQGGKLHSPIHSSLALKPLPTTDR